MCLFSANFAVGAYTVVSNPTQTTMLDIGVYLGIVLLDTPQETNAVAAYYISSYVSATVQSNFESSQNEIFDSLYSSAYRLSTATLFYNCHSYAWHSQNTSTNHYWIDNPSPYYDSDIIYYEEVDTPSSGDIICYFDDNETPNNISDDINLHSGIVISSISGATSNGKCGISNTLIVESKWGAAGLYRHNGYECPYTDYNESEIEAYRADYVKFYHISSHSHTHTHSYNQINSLEYHACVCSCGQIVHSEHRWESTPIRPNYTRYSVSPTYIPQYTCRDCGMRTLNP